VRELAHHKGGCECGVVRYRMTGEPMFVNCCHCRQCHKLTGSAFALNAMIERANVEVTQGANDVADGRCRRCHVILWATHRMFGQNVLFLRVGTLDESEHFAPDAHFFMRSKHPWVTIPAGVRTFETLPGKGDAPLMSGEAIARLEAVQTA
jgi:hypothetical protein